MGDFPEWYPSVQSVPSLTEGTLWEAGPGLGEPGAPWGWPPGAPGVLTVVTVLVLAVAATAACKGRKGEKNSQEGKNRLGRYKYTRQQTEETNSGKARKKKMFLHTWTKIKNTQKERFKVIFTLKEVGSFVCLLTIICCTQNVQTFNKAICWNAWYGIKVIKRGKKQLWQINYDWNTVKLRER